MIVVAIVLIVLTAVLLITNASLLSGTVDRARQGEEYEEWAQKGNELTFVVVPLDVVN